MIQAVVAGAPEKVIVLQSNLHFTVQLFFSARNIRGPKLSFIQCIQTLVTVQFSREKKTLQSNVKQFKDEEKIRFVFLFRSFSVNLLSVIM